MSFPFPLLLLGTYTRKLTQKSSSCLSCFLAQLKPTIHWTRASQPVPAAHTTYRYTCFQFLKILASSTCTRLHSQYGPTCECVQLTIRFENTCKQSKALGDWQANVSQLVRQFNGVCFVVVDAVLVICHLLFSKDFHCPSVGPSNNIDASRHSNVPLAVNPTSTSVVTSKPRAG